MGQSGLARLRMLGVVVGCTAALGLAACGGDDDETTASETTVSESTTEAPTDTTTSSIDTSDLPDADELRDQFNTQLLQVLTTDQDLTDAQAQCAIDVLEEEISDEELQAAIVEAAQSGQPPQDLIDTAFDAGAQCADE